MVSNGQGSCVFQFEKVFSCWSLNVGCEGVNIFFNFKNFFISVKIDDVNGKEYKEHMERD